MCTYITPYRSSVRSGQDRYIALEVAAFLLSTLLLPIHIRAVRKDYAFLTDLPANRKVPTNLYHYRNESIYNVLYVHRNDVSPYVRQDIHKNDNRELIKKFKGGARTPSLIKKL